MLPVVVQFRPAWAVQLALRAAGVEHKVVNSSYAVSEATGPLPYLQDSSALVGGSYRQIIDYLVETKQIELSTALSSTSTTNTEPLLSSMEMIDELVNVTLVNCLNVFRYQDTHAWKASERPRMLSACKGKWFMGHWHVWAERHTALEFLPSTMRTLTQAKSKVQSAYAFLDHTLQTSPEVFLDGRQFTAAGLGLFEHIMHALADSYLATILHAYPALCHYGQTVWERYFFAADSPIATVNEDNQKENVSNPFFVSLPSGSSNALEPSSSYRLVMPMKAGSSTTEASWQKRLKQLARDAAASVPVRPSSYSHAAAPASSSFAPEHQRREDSKTTNTAEAAVAAYQTADQRWVASVILVAAVAFARMLGSSTQAQAGAGVVQAG